VGNVLEPTFTVNGYLKSVTMSLRKELKSLT